MWCWDVMIYLYPTAAMYYIYVFMMYSWCMVASVIVAYWYSIINICHFMNDFLKWMKNDEFYEYYKNYEKLQKICWRQRKSCLRQQKRYSLMLTSSSATVLTCHLKTRHPLYDKLWMSYSLKKDTLKILPWRPLLKVLIGHIDVRHGFNHALPTIVYAVEVWQ